MLLRFAVPLLACISLPLAAEDFHLYLRTSGPVVDYPSPVVVEADVQGDTSIAGLTASAIILDPNHRKVDTVFLLDDGLDADALRDDGVYTGVFDYASDGDYTIHATADNSVGFAYRTTAAELSSTFPDGSAQDPSALLDEPVRAPFSVSGSAAVTVQGTEYDDHEPQPMLGCTSVPADNRDVPGRIDFPGDEDCFEVVLPPGRLDDLVLRSAYQAGGMDTVFMVFSSLREYLGSADKHSTERPEEGVVMTIDSHTLRGLEGLHVVIRHRDTSGRGYYSFSAQNALNDCPEGMLCR